MSHQRRGRPVVLSVALAIGLGCRLLPSLRAGKFPDQASSATPLAGPSDAK